LISSILALEVMDKEWPLWLVLAGFLGFGLVGLLFVPEMADDGYHYSNVDSFGWD